MIIHNHKFKSNTPYRKFVTCDTAIKSPHKFTNVIPVPLLKIKKYFDIEPYMYIHVLCLHIKTQTMKILAIGASSSKASINKQFASFTANQVKGAEVNTLDLNDYEMAIYSSDRENETGIPAEATKFRALIEESDGIVISFAEHNGTYSAAFKNIFDWVSRTEGKTWGDKPMLVLATSPGARGGETVMNQAASTLPYQGALVTGKFSLPSFYESFSNNEGIKDVDLKADFETQLETFTSKLAN